MAGRCIKEGIKVAVINGPSAGICALVGSGLNADHFYFYGFLSAKSTERKTELRSLVSFPSTLIFYESPHRIDEMLKDVSVILGTDRPACLCRELTKTHEEYIRGTLGEIAALDPTTLIGEMVLIVSGAPLVTKEITDGEIAEILKEKLLHGVPYLAPFCKFGAASAEFSDPTGLASVTMPTTSLHGKEKAMPCPFVLMPTSL